MALFKRLDKDESGALSRREIRPLARRMKFSAAALFKRMDRDGNGKINFSEFAVYMRKHGART